jgi:hypothetical protein
MPEEGTFITVGNLTAELKDERISPEFREIRNNLKDAIDGNIEQENIWQCRKCKSTDYIFDGVIFVCSNCGHREVKK